MFTWGGGGGKGVGVGEWRGDHSRQVFEGMDITGPSFRRTKILGP